MDALISIDYYLTLLINGIHSPFWDQFFFLISNKALWIPLYVAFVYIIIQKEGKAGWLIILSMIVVVLLSDQISSGILKPLVERLRPSHDPLLVGKIHLVNNYAGGLYGFASSHAANTAGVACFLILLLRNYLLSFSLLLWTILTSYSRVYLGVHFVGDVLCGAMIGALSAILIYFLLRHFAKKHSLPLTFSTFSVKECYPVLVVFLSSLIFVFVKSV